MGKIYWNMPEIPIPNGGLVNTNDGRVFVISRRGDGSRKRTMIGHATSDITMHPNNMFRFLYPAEWNEAYGDKEYSSHELHTGIYAASLGIGYQTNIYPLLQEVYGPQIGNAMMDYVMYMLLDRNAHFELFEERMRDHFLYSSTTYSDSWYSDLFQNKITEAMIHQFRISWLDQCVKNNVTHVWLSIDGSNNDCSMTDSDLAEKGKAKSGLNVPIVSYIWAINAEDGTPVTYFINNGSVVDAKAFQEIITFLATSKIEIDGVILDCGFANHDVIQTLKDLNLPYIIMLKSVNLGHVEMMKEYSESIRWKVKQVVNNNGVFGISDYKPIFSGDKDYAYISLFFDGSNGSARSITMIDNILKVAENLQKGVDEGKTPAVPKNYDKIITIDSSGGKQFVQFNYDVWQQSIDQKGFYSIASSQNLGAKKIHYLYHLRDASEKQFMIMKSHLGFDSLNVHSDASLRAKFATCFVAAIIRSKFMSGCQKLQYDTNRMIKEIDRISLVLLPDGSYTAISNLTTRQKNLLSFFSIENDAFKVFATDENNRRNSSIFSQVHRLPNDQNRFAHKKGGRPAKPKDETESSMIKRGRGRPKGSKNKKTLEREAMENSESKTTPRSRGRPKGSKNKKTLLREKKQADVPSKPKQHRGRPAGSKNKKTLLKEKQIKKNRV